MASYWIDTLVLKNGGKYLRYSAASSLPLRGKPTQAQDIARRIFGAIDGESTQKVNIPGTTTRNMSTCDHHYWSLKGHGFSFATFL